MREQSLRRLALPPVGAVDFASNDYLGVARSEEVHEAILQRLQGPAHGSTGSRLLTGHSAAHEALEHKIARFHRGEAALLFNSGYLANLSLIDTFLSPGESFLCDLHAHASVWDGARLAHAKPIPFRHNDLNSLEGQLRRNEVGKIVYVEAVYSTDGSMAPLEEMAELCLRYGARLIVDEAHSVGLFGRRGEGRVVELGLEVFATLYTYGKAFGVHGAAIVGSREVREYLIQFARPFCYTTALPLHALLALDEAYNFVERADKERAHVRHLARKFFGKESPIEAIRVPGNGRVLAVAQRVQQAGFDVRPLRSPTVRRGEEALRLCLHAFNREEEVERCLNEISGSLQAVEQMTERPLSLAS